MMDGILVNGPVFFISRDAIFLMTTSFPLEKNLLKFFEQTLGGSAQLLVLPLCVARMKIVFHIWNFGGSNLYYQFTCSLSRLQLLQLN